jgi:pyruvate,orthophosphate dikinase
MVEMPRESRQLRRAPGARGDRGGTEREMAKWVYGFGDGKAEGRAEMRDLLGGKGANLAEMANLGLPVPPGFTITAEVCSYFSAHGKSYPPDLEQQVGVALERVGKITGKKFGDRTDPLLVSVPRGRARRCPA